MNVIDSPSRFHDLGLLLDPKSVAVIGASEQPGNLGGVAISLMQKFGFAGDLWPVNPRRATVHGLTCFDSIAALPRPADLALIATGADSVADIVRACAEAGTRYGIVWAGGFSEVGEKGAALQETLVKACRETGFSLVGPNCLGIINSKSAMVASFASFLVESERLIPGNVAMISQSGGLATMAQALAQRKNIGFNLTISTGNEVTLTVSDYIHAVAADDDTKVITAYVEGIRDGDRFIEAVSAARAAGKPLVVLKGGLTETSAQAAAAHTGALAGERRVWDAIADELGILSVGSLEEMLDVALYLSRLDLSRWPKGKRVAIVTFGGGAGVLSADQCAARGLEVPPLRPETRVKLAPLVPPIAATRNPIDVTPQTFNQEKWFATFPAALDTIAADPGIDIVVCQFGPQAQRGAETAHIVSALRERTEKTICLAWPLAPKGIPEILDGEGMYVFQEYERAIATLAKLAAHPLRAHDDRRQDAAARFDWMRLVPNPVPGLVISEDECHRILSEAGVATAPGALARSADEAIGIARSVGLPVAAKGISAKVTHRAAAGLVALGLASEDDVRGAFRTLTARAGEDGIALDGIYIQKMVPDGVEIIVSAFRDPIFGPIVSCGWGGRFTEIVQDVAMARAPLDHAGALRLLKRLKIVAGARKLDPAPDIEALATFVAHFSTIARSAPWESYVIELNPVKWTADGAVAVDGLLIIQKP
jgi:acyl-CoA synthetase (NDP forming)